jgi:ligand-binding SRPBCC domain-containing protein
MPTIHLTTVINAPLERCFNLARSIDLHQASNSKTKEKAIAGVTTGIIEQGETVTWRAKHLGIYQKLITEITIVEYPYLFEDKMLKGAFKKMKHLHLFEQKGEQTIMKDIFEFESPFGFIGKLFNKLVLTSYMKRFLTERNKILKTVAESDQWKKYLEV